MPKSKYITGIVYGFKLCESFSFTNLGNKLLVKVVKARLVVGVDRRSDGDEEDDVVLSKPLPLSENDLSVVCGPRFESRDAVFDVASDFVS